MAQNVLNAVAPVLKQGYLGTYLTMMGGIPNGSNQPLGCQTIGNGCESGSAEFCPDENGGMVNFSDCVNSGVTANGSIAVAGDQFFGSATFDVTFNSVGVTGLISYAFDAKTGCVTETFSSVMVTSEGVTYFVAGDAVYCATPVREGAVGAGGDDPVPSSGTLQIEVPREGQESLYVSLLFQSDPPGSFELSMYDADINKFILNCTGSLISLQLTCTGSTTIKPLL